MYGRRPDQQDGMLFPTLTSLLELIPVARHPRSEMLTAINHPLSAVETLRLTQGGRCAGPAAADEGRLDEAKAALEHSLASSELFGAPLLVVANKQVQRQAMPCSATARMLHCASRRCRAQGFLRLLRQFLADIDVRIACSLDMLPFNCCQH